MATPSSTCSRPGNHPRRFPNRYRWRASSIYRALVRDPQNRLLDAGLGDAELRYAEIRALVGGVTAIQGASGRTRSTEEALVRNVDLRIFGRHRARAMIDLPSPTSRDAARLKAIVAGIGRGEIDAFYLHLAEGQAGDERSATSSGGWSTTTTGSPRPPC